MSIYVHDLPVEPKAGVVLYCTQCGETFSAQRGDYFAAEPDTPIAHCGWDMVLAKRKTHIYPVTPEEADRA